MVMIMVVKAIIMVSMRMVMVNAWSWHLWPPMHCNGVTVSVQSWCYGDAPGHWVASKVHLIDCQGRHQVLKDDFLESCSAAQSIWFFSFGLQIKFKVRSFVRLTWIFWWSGSELPLLPHMPLIDCKSGVDGDGDVDGEDLHLGSTACCQVSSSVSKVPPSPLDYFRLLQVCVWVCMWIWLVGWCKKWNFRHTFESK